MWLASFFWRFDGKNHACAILHIAVSWQNWSWVRWWRYYPRFVHHAKISSLYLRDSPDFSPHIRPKRAQKNCHKTLDMLKYNTLNGLVWPDYYQSQSIQSCRTDHTVFSSCRPLYYLVMEETAIWKNLVKHDFNYDYPRPITLASYRSHHCIRTCSMISHRAAKNMAYELNLSAENRSVHCGQARKY